MSLLSKVKVNNTNYDLAALQAQGIYYGEVDSTSTATVFTATIPGITEYRDGTCILLRNGVITSASGFTININGLGAKPSYNNMTLGNSVTPTDPTRDTTIFNINYAMLFIYNSTVVSGGCWICYRGYDANSNTIGYQVRTNNSTMKAADKFYRYRLLFTSADGHKWVPANTSTSTNTTSKRDVNQRPIDPFGEIVYYGSTSVIDANENVTSTQLWQQYYGSYTNIGYSFNRTGAAATMTAASPIYIKCTPQANGSAIIDPDTPYTQTLPSSEDGYIYIYLGRAVNATLFEILINHPVYYYKDGAIRLWTNTAASASTAGTFYAVYGTTTWAEMEAAYTAGQTIFCVYNNIIYPMVAANWDTGGAIRFQGFAYDSAGSQTQIYIDCDNIDGGTWNTPSSSDIVDEYAPVKDVTVNGSSVVSSGVAAISMATVATSGSYSDLSNKPTDSNGIVTLSHGGTGLAASDSNTWYTDTTLHPHFEVDMSDRFVCNYYGPLDGISSVNDFLASEYFKMAVRSTVPVYVYGFLSFTGTILTDVKNNHPEKLYILFPDAVPYGQAVVNGITGTLNYNTSSNSVYLTNINPNSPYWLTSGLLVDDVLVDGSSVVSSGTAQLTTGTSSGTLAAGDHTHGNITASGDITTTATIASGDRLVINDETSSQITNSSITFGTSQTEFLANDGTWQIPAGGVSDVTVNDTSVVSDGIAAITGDLTDTKNTAGSTDTSSKIYLVGATSQAANPQTYSDNQVYATNGQLDANKVRVAEHATMQWNSTDSSLDFVFA